jgi:hypothetical protein
MSAELGLSPRRKYILRVTGNEVLKEYEPIFVLKTEIGSNSSIKQMNV